SSPYGGGGGGAGGGVRIISTGTLTLCNSCITSTGGVGGTGGSAGGAGSTGRLALLSIATVVGGSENPPYNATSADNVTFVDPFPMPPASPTFTATSSSSLSLSWQLEDPASETPVVVVSTSMFFTPVLAVATGTLGEQTTTWNVPFDNTTYYFKVKDMGEPETSYSVVASTLNDIAAPTAIVFDDISSTTITASAFAPLPAFSTMSAGMTGTDVQDTTNLADSGWHGEAWTALSGPVNGRKDVSDAVVSLGGRLYVVGGNDSANTAYATVDVYDPVSASWAGAAPMLLARGQLAAAALGGKLYAMGGRYAPTNFQYTDNEQYDPVADTWTARAPMLSARYLAAAAALDGRIYLVGGTNGVDLNTVEEYDPDADAWTARAQLGTARNGVGLGVVGGKLIAAGGSGLSACESYDPAANTWNPVAPVPAVASNPWASTVLGGRLWLFSGSLSEEYDPAADTWAVRSPMPLPLTDGGAAALGGKVYVAQGDAAGAPQPMLASFDPGTSFQFTGLQPNSNYSFTAVARNALGVKTASVSASTYTLAVATSPASGDPFYMAGTSSATVTWGDGNGVANGPETFIVEAATSTSFLPVTSSATVSASFSNQLVATLGGMSANSTFYFRVQAANQAGETDYSWYLLGSTVTPIEAPTGVVFDSVSSSAVTASAYALRFSSMAAGLSGTRFVMDGSVASAWHGESFKPLASSLTHAENDPAGAAVGGRFYVVSGNAGASPDSWNQEYDPVTNAWTQRAGIPHPRQGARAAAVGGQLYVIGGYNAVPVSFNDSYDPESDAWTPHAPLPTARQNTGVAVVGSTIYVLGGNGGSGTAVCEAYDVDDDSWTARPAMPVVHDDAAAAVLGGRIYVVGGSGALASVDAFDLASGSWLPAATVAPLPAGLEGPSMAAIGGKLWVTGGLGSLTESGAVYSYDPAAAAWSTAAVSMPWPRYLAAAGVLGGQLYVAGGWNGSSASGENDLFDPGVAASFSGLLPDSQHSFVARARDSVGGETGDSLAVSTYTLAVATAPQFGGPIADWVGASSVSVDWYDGGAPSPNSETFVIEASTISSFVPTLSSTTYAATGGQTVLSDVLAGLPTNTTVYFRIKAYNALGATDESWYVLGSTVTGIETPTAVVFDDISSATITAAAYAPGAAFSSMTVGLSGTLIARDGFYDPTQWHGERWTVPGNTLFYARWGLAVAPLGGRLYAVGGDNAGATLNANEEYDPVAASWITRTGMPTPRYGLGAAVVGGVLYAVGGDPTSTENESYDPEADVWSSRAPMSTGRGGAAVAAVDGKVYVIDGTNGPVATNEMYDPVTDSWVGRNVSPTARSYVGAAVVGGKIYVLGGQDVANTPLASVEVYDTRLDSWISTTSMPTARSGLAAAAVGGKIYALGGDASGSVLRTVEAYEPAASTWTTLTQLPNFATRLGAAALGGRIVAAGGTSGPSPVTTSDSGLNNYYWFDPGTGQSFTGLQPNSLHTFNAKARNA
ncbi:MAG: hypothetical protein KGL53_17120, partial [Elusimicrobia bacterium]|nr:hypothetical protein [Elusimicrobiota bacterium]